MGDQSNLVAAKPQSGYKTCGDTLNAAIGMRRHRNFWVNGNQDPQFTTVSESSQKGCCSNSALASEKTQHLLAGAL
jgi:hypothetical protein